VSRKKPSYAPVPTPNKAGGRFFAMGLTVVALAAAGYFGKGLLGTSVQAGLGLVLHEVKSQDLDIVVVERGSLESGKNVDLVCEVEARTAQSAATTILQIVKEGSHVTKGELLVELDSASLKDQITQQKIKVEQAKASLTKANTELEITRSQNESDIQAAQIAVELTEIDLRKYVEGDYLQERRNIDGEIVIAEEELNRAKERFDYSEKLSKKGYVSASEVEADRLSVTKSQNALNVAKEKLRVLDEYTKPRQVKDLENKLEEAKRKLDRVRNEATAKEAQSESGMLAQKLTTETEENTFKKLERQLDKCRLYAPTDGMVVYANDPGAAMRGQPQVQIEEGASVRERQKIIRIPDLGSMQVNVKVHEAKVSHVRPGQSARVRVESLPDKTLPATVRTVATTADAQQWFSSGVQVYTVMVGVNESVEGLKPGMTAEVEIFADRLEDTIAVPVQAIVEREGQSYCYVLPPNADVPEIRRVKVGASNDKMAAIEEDGLKVGERVVQNLIAVIDEEVLAARAKSDAAQYKVESPVPVVAKQPGAPAGPGAAAGQGGMAGGRGPGGPGGAASEKSAGGAAGLLQAFDKNGDGKITLADEVPEERRGFLARLDGNSDGQIDAGELAAMRGRGAGGPAPQMPASGAEMIKLADKNSDGKLAKEELDERAQGFFSMMDSNGDGFVDESEADATVQRMKQFQQQGGVGGGAGGAPGGGGGLQ
jgi:RND family efflux transporter MFP subunit